jgi:hypothetical protein
MMSDTGLSSPRAIHLGNLVNNLRFSLRALQRGILVSLLSSITILDATKNAA